MQISRFSALPAFFNADLGDVLGGGGGGESVRPSVSPTDGQLLTSKKKKKSRPQNN